MIKVLNISTSRLNYNGVGIVLLNYFKYINKTKIRMDYLAPDVVDKKFKQEIKTTNNKIYELGYNGNKLKHKHPILYFFKILKIMKDEKYDIVHIHGSSSVMFVELLAAKLAGVKIRIAHSHNTKSDHSVLNYIFRPFFKILYTNAFACGEEAGKYLFGKNSKFEIIPNGKNIKDYEFNVETRKSIREKYSINNDEILIGHVGNFNYQKNHEYVIDVFYELTKMNPKYKLILIGNGDNFNKICELVNKRNLKDKVIFLGQIKVEEVAKVIQAIDIIIFPSRFEGFPNVLIEWQIAGLNCIISDKITRAVKITELVEFMSIDDLPINWAKKIEKMKLNDRIENKKRIEKKVIEAGFDIVSNAKNLETMYINYLKMD